MDTSSGCKMNLFSKQGFANDDLNGAGTGESSVELTALQPALVTLCQKCRAVNTERLLEHSKLLYC